MTLKTLRRQIDEIDKTLAGLAAQKEIDDRYSQAIASGDRLQATGCIVQSATDNLRTADCRLKTENCRLKTANFMNFTNFIN